MTNKHPLAVLVVMSFLSILLCAGLVYYSRHRKAAVGRLEMAIFLGVGNDHAVAS